MTPPAEQAPVQGTVAGTVVMAALLVLLGGWIAVTGHTPGDDDPWIPLLALAFLLAIHHPVVWRRPPAFLSAAGWLVPAALFIAGNLLTLLTLQAAGWTLAFRRLAQATVGSSGVPVSRSWLAFFFLFPWITHDFPQVGWWFRLSGATVTGWLFAALDFPVVQQGTNLLVGGLPMSVEAACAGMGLLQSLLVVGVILLLLHFPSGPWFYLLLPALPVLAWMANTARIATITAVGLSAGIPFSQGLFHTWGGLFVTLVMVVATLIFLRVIRRLTCPQP